MDKTTAAAKEGTGIPPRFAAGSIPTFGGGVQAMTDKPRILLADYQWLMAFEKFKGLPRGTRLEAEGLPFKFSHDLDDPHPPSLWLTYRQDKKQHEAIIRKGDKVIFELVKSLTSAKGKLEKV